MSELDSRDHEIAVVGLSGRFPGARSAREFWQNLKDGVESIRTLSEAEARSCGIDRSRLGDPSFVRAVASLEDVDRFDAAFFEISPREAAIMDPQHRLFLECSWEALEDAGYDPQTYGGAVGVFGGVGTSSYLIWNICSHPEILDTANGLDVELGNRGDYLTNRVSYRLGLRGPSVTVQTACSTSLVAVHLACDSLLSGQCDMAMAGGATVLMPQRPGYTYLDGGMWSPDGHCRAFDGRAAGTVCGSGVGVVVLKRLSDALAEGDHIYAVIKGSATNNDGSAKVGFTAPGVDGQARVISEALALAGVHASTVSYVEAQGTGTALGDPLEISALTQAFGATTNRLGYCAIGSVKTNVGHLVAAAGVAGLIKTVLALESELIPPSLHYESPNPEIDFSKTPFFVNTQLRRWKRGDTPRRAGVSSFGMGGTNAHVVLEEAPRLPSAPATRPSQLVLLSARTGTALEAATENLREHLRTHPGESLADVAYTSQVGRRAFSHRRAVVCRDLEGAVASLASLDRERVTTGRHDGVERRVTFLFPGHGALSPNRTREIYDSEPAYRREIDACAAVIRKQLGCDVSEALFPASGQEESAAAQLRDPVLSLLSLFTVEYSLARLWTSWGVRPEAMMGHGAGELTAACLAGVFGVDECVALIATRGRLLGKLASGPRLAVRLPEAGALSALGPELFLAAVDAPSLCTVAGDARSLEALRLRLTEQKVDCSLLDTPQTIPTAVTNAILVAFEEAVRRARPKRPEIPFVSSVTGTWVAREEATDPRYWARQLRSTIRFSDGVRQLLVDERRTLLEIGPGDELTTLARAHLEKESARRALASLSGEGVSEVEQMLGATGRLWLSGVPIDWKALHGDDRRRRVSLPTYPFERRRHWIEPRKRGARGEAAHGGKLANVEEWLYQPLWTQSGVAVAERENPVRDAGPWLVFVESSGWSDRLVARLREQGGDVVAVRAGRRFTRLGRDSFRVDPESRSDYSALVRELVRDGRPPRRILHAWCVTRREGRKHAARMRYAGFYSLVFLARALHEHGSAETVELDVISTGIQSVTGDEPLSPAKAAVLAPCKVIPQEYPWIRCRSIDTTFADRSGRLDDLLLADLVAPESRTEPVVAYRGSRRWVQRYEHLPAPDQLSPKALRRRGVYLITGGLAGIGLALAEHLAETAAADLIITGAGSVPGPPERQRWLETHDENDATSRRIRRLLDLESKGARVLYRNAEATDLARLAAAVRDGESRFGAIHGVIHAGDEVEAHISPISELTSEECEAYLERIDRELCNLERALRGMHLDFVLLTSSLSSVLGGIGYAAYTGATLHADAMAHEMHARGAVPWISVNWDSWHLDDVGGRRPLMNASLNEYGITPREGAQVFARLAAFTGTPRIVVSTGELEPRIDEWIRLDAASMAWEGDAPSGAVGVETHSDRVSEVEYVAPRDEIEEALADIWQRLLGFDRIGIHDNFFDLGGHSLLAVVLFKNVERRLGRKLPVSALIEAPTVGQLAALLTRDERSRGEPHAAEWPSIVRMERRGTNPPFFCVHGAGGNVLLYRELARHLGAEQPFYGLQAQGLDGKRPFYTTIDEMAAHYLTEIRAVQPEGPYFLGGYCMGGTLAYHIAQDLLARGERVALLALFDTQARWHRFGLPHRACHLLQKVAFHIGNLFLAGPRGQATFLSEKLRVLRRRATPFLHEITHRYRSDRHDPIVRLTKINDGAALSYRPRPYAGKVTLFCPRTLYLGQIDPRRDWETLARGGVEVHELDVYPGGMLVEPFVEALAEQLRECLRRARTEHAEARR